MAVSTTGTDRTFDYFLLKIFIYGIAKKPDEKKSKEDEEIFADLSSFNLIHHSQAKCQLVQTS